MNVAIIAAAGQGTRMAGKRPKQFLELAGTPILIHTLKAFERCDAIHEIIVVLAAEETDGFLDLTRKHGLRKIAAVVSGGPSRAESVLNGLRVVDAEAVEIVAVHDGVRPFVTAEEISRTVAFDSGRHDKGSQVRRGGANAGPINNSECADTTMLSL
jgi:2-C-methyl-D-erythritol 4-phosphate cytidylyltransferase